MSDETSTQDLSRILAATRRVVETEPETTILPKVVFGEHEHPTKPIEAVSEAPIPAPVVEEVVKLKVKKPKQPTRFVMDTPIVKEATEEQPEVSEDGESEDTYVDPSEKFNINLEDDSTVSFVTTGPEKSVVKEEDQSISEINKLKIGFAGINKTAKDFEKFTPVTIDPVNTEIYQRAIIEQYITGTKNGGFIGPRGLSKVVLPYSGIYLDISTYSNSEMLSIHRNSDNIDFVEKIEAELYSAWEHTVNNSLKRKLTFEEWCTAIKYPDIWCIYWGIYNVNNPGINEYKAVCDRYADSVVPCRTNIIEERDNYDISSISHNSVMDITADTIDNIRNGIDRSFIGAYKTACTIIEKEDLLPESRIKVFHGIPNLHEVLMFLKFLKQQCNESDEVIKKVLYPVSSLYQDGTVNDKSLFAKVLSYKYNMFVRKLYTPAPENVEDPTKPGSKIVKITYVDVEPSLIPLIINRLSRVDYLEFIKGREFKKLVVKEGVYFIVTNSVCPVCKTKQMDIAIDIRDSIFTRAERLMELIIDM